MNLARQIVEVGLRLVEAGVTDGVTGNISVRLPDVEAILITPTSRDYRLLGERDLVHVHLQSAAVEGRRRPSSEWRLHAAIYNGRADVNAVVHHHSTWASAVAVSGKTIPVLIDEAADIGEIPTAPYAASASPELADIVGRQFAGGYNAVLLANHGAVTVGRSLGEAFRRALEVERLAKIYIGAQLLGGARALDATAVTRSREFFTGYRQEADEPLGPVPSVAPYPHDVRLHDLMAFSFRAGITFAHLLQSFILRRVHR